MIVSAFSAGYGGVRALLSDERTAEAIDGVILLDGLHTSYVPERTVLAEGGALDTTSSFRSCDSRGAPWRAGESAHHTLRDFPRHVCQHHRNGGLADRGSRVARTPVLAWGPGGMQQVSEVRRGGLTILGFAGNTGPDHIDHLHGLREFLAQMERDR